MADRTVNINIKYNVNTADVQKAAQQTAAAQKATDQLRKSTEAAGKAGQDAGNKTAQAFKGTGATVKQAANEFNGLVSAAKLLVAAGVAREVLNIGLEMASLSGKVEGVSRAFQRTFPNSVDLLNKLRKATHETVTDFELMQRTLQATNLGVGVKELPQLFEFAATRAQQTGESVDYLVDSIVRGIGRKSPLILDNLGISAIRLKEKFDGAALASQSVADVTKAVAEIAQEELGKMGGYVETSETKVKQLEASFETLRQTIAKKVESGGALDFIRDRIKDVTEFLKGSKQVREEQQANNAATDAARVIESDSFKELKDNNANKIKFLQEEISMRQQQVAEYAILLGQNKQNYDDIAKTGKMRSHAQNEEIQGILDTIKVQETKQSTINQTIDILKKYVAELKNANSVEAEAPKGLIESKKEQIKLLQEQIEKTRNLKDIGLNGKLLIDLEILKGELHDLETAFREFKPVDIDKILNLSEVDIAAEKYDRMSKNVQKSLENISEALKAPTNTGKGIIQPVNLPNVNKVADQSTFGSNLLDNFTDNWKMVLSQTTDIQADFLKGILDQELQSYQNRLTALHTFYANQQNLAGDNQRARDELRVKEDQATKALQVKIFEREKSVRKSQAIIDGAAGVVKAFATAPNIYIAIIQAGIVAAATAKQLALINREQPRFKEGKVNIQGPGTGTSDSIHARISTGESVIKAKATKKSMKLLEGINNMQIDDSILKNLHLTPTGVVTQQMNDKRIVDAIKGLQQPDYFKNGNLIFESRLSADRQHKRIRRKSMG